MSRLPPKHEKIIFESLLPQPAEHIQQLMKFIDDNQVLSSKEENNKPIDYVKLLQDYHRAIHIM